MNLYWATHISSEARLIKPGGVLRLVCTWFWIAQLTILNIFFRHVTTPQGQECGDLNQTEAKSMIYSKLPAAVIPCFHY